MRCGWRECESCAGPRARRAHAARAQAAGLKPLVDYSKKKTAEKHLEELTVNLGELVAADPPLPEADLIAAAKAKKLEWQLPGEEVVKARAYPTRLKPLS